MSHKRNAHISSEFSHLPINPNKKSSTFRSPSQKGALLYQQLSVGSIIWGVKATTISLSIVYNNDDTIQLFDNYAIWAITHTHTPSQSWVGGWMVRTCVWWGSRMCGNIEWSSRTLPSPKKKHIVFFATILLHGGYNIDWIPREFFLNRKYYWVYTYDAGNWFRIHKKIYHEP